MPLEPGKDLGRPLSVWKEKDSIDGSEVDVLVMILKTRGCSWASRTGCTMCGYNSTTFPDITADDLIHQVNSALERYQDETYIKIFTSGSFLDPDEVPVRAVEEITRSISGRSPSARLLVESRPEFISERSLSPLLEMEAGAEIAIGLESSSDLVRGSHIRKGFSWQDYIKAGRTVIESGSHLKTYLLLKPPFLGEGDAIKDCISSIEAVHSLFPGSRISINPMNIQSQSLVEPLFNKHAYRPPWLWSLIEVLKEGYRITNGSTHLMSSPTAG
ncbi:MAG: archaeosine biosynthesis radical SAM protein RaSEA, partial [Thermoplasmatota archaeon]